MEIQIHHMESFDGPPKFEVIRGIDMLHSAAVTLPDPAKFSLEGYPSKKLLPELRWYLEDYLQNPFGVYPQLAESVAKTLQAWGTTVFDTLFTGHARDWYQEAKRKNLKNLCIKITSDSPEIMSWPWEALYSRDDSWLALRCGIERQLISIGAPPHRLVTRIRDSIHILYIIPRPYGDSDVGYHILANSLVDFIVQNNLPVTVDVLRPPTFDQLRKALYDRPGYYHIVHFDGHGGYGIAPPMPAGNLYAAPEGQLVFETIDGEPDCIDTRRLALLLAEYNIPFVVMNACQSGMIDDRAQDPFASVATGLLKAGVHSVIAMGYSLYVSGAKEFIPAFYERLLSSGQVSEAMRAGRGQMLRQPERNCITGTIPLQDWVVPVLYQQLSAKNIALLKPQRERKPHREESKLPEDAKLDGDYGFIGRGSDIQKLERAILRQRQAAILLHGQAGVGKTSLVKGFLRWLENTGGLGERIFWFNFQEIYSLEYIINQLVDGLMDASVMAKPMEVKQRLLIQCLWEKPYLLVWDNFESASGIEGTEIQPNLSVKDRDVLAQLLKGLRGGKTKIFITSRNNESWLNIQSCYRLFLDGLSGEDQWEYCNAVVKEIGLTLDRKDKTYSDILHKLCGNPLAIRAVLLRLQDCPAGRLLAELDENFEGMEGDEATRRLQSAYKVFSDTLIGRFLPVLQLTGLHEYCVFTEPMKKMLVSAKINVSPDIVDSCYSILADAGFCTHIGQGFYRLHPALRGYLLKQMPAPEPLQKGFADIMGMFADGLAIMPIHEARLFYQLNTANFYYARRLAERYKMDVCNMALTQSLAHYATMTFQFEEATILFTVLAEKTKSCNHWDGMASTFHQLGIIAEKQHDYTTAKEWYQKSLAIYEKQGNVQRIAEEYNQLGNVAQWQNDLATAEDWYKKELEIYEKQENMFGKANAFHQLGIIAEKKSDFTSAEIWYKKSLAISEKYKNTQLSAQTYNQLGSVAAAQHDFAAAKAWCQKSLAIEKEQGNTSGMAFTYQQLGYTAIEQRDFAAAENWYKKVLAINEKQGDTYGAVGIYSLLGNIAAEQHDFAIAEGWYKKSLEFFERQGDTHKAANICNKLGRLSQERHNVAAAEGWYKKTLTIAEKESTAIACFELGSIAQDKHDFAMAEGWYHKSLALSEELGNVAAMSRVYCELGGIAQKQRDFAAAKNWYKKSQGICEQHGIMFSLDAAYHQLGKIAEEQGNFAEAEDWYNKSLAIDKKEGDAHNAASNYYQLGNIAEKQHNFLRAAEFYLSSLQALAGENDAYNLAIMIYRYANLIHKATGTERSQLRNLWLMHVPPEWTKYLKKAEEKLNDT